MRPNAAAPETMQSGVEFERLLNEAVDGRLTESEESALAAILQNDAEARRRYLQFMQLHADLQWDHGAAAALLVDPETRSRDMPTSGTGRWGRSAVLAIVMGGLAVCVLVGLGIYQQLIDTSPTRDAPTVAMAELIQGAVSFRAAGEQNLVSGDRIRELPSGTLLVEGETSAAQIRFLDGTLITVSGDAEVGLSDDRQKRLQVRHGILTAEVRPQPADAPLVVETSTARVEVLGTVFTLAAEAEQTRINVDEGRVRLRRLVDGQTVEVPPEHSCVASLDARDKLRTDAPDQPSPGWEHQFTQPPPARWKGQWLPADGDLPARVRAVACLVGRKQQSDDRPIVHYGVTARKVDGVRLGSLPKNGVLRITLRTEQPAKLQIMLGLNRADGRFGGNFEVKLPADRATPRDDGWQELTVPLADFYPLIQRYPEMAENAQPYLLLITTFGRDAGLEVCEMAITAGGTEVEGQ